MLKIVIPTHKAIHICKPHKPAHEPKLAKENAFPTAQKQRHNRQTNHERQKGIL
jgi:hypothetical protein